MFALERVVLEERELDFAPDALKRFRNRLRAGAAGTTATAIAGGLTALVATTGPIDVAMVAMVGLYSMCFGGLGAYFAHWVADGPARRVVQRRLEKLARGTAGLGALRALADGELVRVRGRVAAPIAPTPTGVHGHPAVVQRLRLNLDGTKVLVDRGADFSVEEEGGVRTRVEIAGAVLVGLARPMPWLTVDPSLHAQLLERAQEVDLSPAARTISARNPYVGELLVREGDLVDLVGGKRRAIDPARADRLARDAPFEATIGSSRALPLLLAPVEPRPTRGGWGTDAPKSG